MNFIKCFLQIAWFYTLIHIKEILCKRKDGGDDDGDWVEPGAWKHKLDEVALGAFRDLSFDNNMCPCDSLPRSSSPADADAAAGLILFRKFVTNLLGRAKLQYNDFAAKYERAIVFKVTPAQLEKLETLRNPRDLDNILTEIFLNAEKPSTCSYNFDTGNTNVFKILLEIFSDLLKLLHISEVRFCLYVVAVALAIWFVHRKYKIGIITMIITGTIIFGYFHTYLECNRELALKQVIEAIDNGATPWYSSLTSWLPFQDSKKVEGYQNLKKSTKLHLDFCRPDHVFLLYINDLFLKQLEFLLEKCQSTIVNIQGSLGFPFNYIAIIALLSLIGYIVKLTFQYILTPRAWIGFFHSHSRAKSRNSDSSSHHDGGNDRISGENLKMLLNVMNQPKVTVKYSGALPSSSVSGVQNIQESSEKLPTAEITKHAEVLAATAVTHQTEESTESKSNSDKNSKISLETETTNAVFIQNVGSKLTIQDLNEDDDGGKTS